ncbi:MAG TPA: terminase large subunit [Cyclobacteriaceae bacterium]|nr:terminase large subunit [Cyclobacteriaceae bacterium]
MTKPERYIHDVLKKKIKTGELARAAVQRHINDLKRKRWDYHFDHSAGLDIIRRMETFRHHEGKLIGQPFILTPWQSFVVYVVFGWKDKQNKRRFKYAYVEIAKKNGKTAFAALIALFLMIMDGESNAEIYTFASHKDQAKICFNDCQKMLKFMATAVPSIQSKVWIGQNGLAWYPTASKITPMSKDKAGGGKKDGIRAHGGICDEYHAHDDNTVFDQVKSSMINRDQPLMWIITTAGFNKLGPCYSFRETVVQVLQGDKQSDITFGIIYTLDKDDDEADPSNWIKSNPSMDVPGCATIKNLKLEYEDSIAKGAAAEVNFKTKNLNRWTDSEEVWVNDRTWMKNSHGIKVEELEGGTCYGGLDLASGIDFNAFTLVFPEFKTIKGKQISPVLTWYWKPSELIVDKRQKRDYRQWVKDGHIIDTPGNIIDWSYISDKIKALSSTYQIHSISYDPYRANHGVLQDLTSYGIQMYGLAQVMSHLSEPTSQLETLATNAQFEHFGNPVTRWMMGNVKIIRDSKGNVMITKGKSKGQVDGPASLVNAWADYLTFKNTETAGGFFVVETKKKENE